MKIPQNVLDNLVELHDKSLHLQAYQLAKNYGDFSEWEGTEAILSAANITHNLGATEYSKKLSVKAWHKDKTNSRAILALANDILHHRGALPALLFVRKHGQNLQVEGKYQVWWLSLQAEIFAALRDFKSADSWHKKALEVESSDGWGLVSKSHTLELQDRYEEALELSREAFRMDGGQRSSAYQTAHLLTLLEKYEEALEILTTASERLENAWIMRQLADLQTELGMHQAAFASLERMIELTPFREKKLDEWIFGSLSNAAYLSGNTEKAIEFAGKTEHKFYQKIKENLSNLKGDEKRVKLKLGFLRQHHFTCAPATLTNISRFWQKKAEHLEIADEMCYDGTPAYKERLWAEGNGWKTQEFTVNWADTVKLIDRGVPFTLATINPGNGHLQAIIGYDEKRKTFLIRDPFYHNFDEFLAEELLADQKSSGPRGMALVPQEKAELFHGLELSDSRIYDFQFAVESALEANDRETASAKLAEMEKEFPDHRLTWSARWSLANYDVNNLKLLEAVEKLSAQFPEDINLKLSYLGISQEFVSRAERLKKLEDFSRAKKTYPLFWQMFGYELGADARNHKRALHWLYKTVRALPSSGLAYRFIADILWSQRRFEEAVELYRFAACLNDKDEQFSYSYFLAMRFLKREEEALRFLRDRFERFGHRSNLPVRSLFYALRELGRTVEAFQVLDDSLKKRSDDGELKLFAAELKFAYGQKNEAENLLNEAEKQSPPNIWLKNAALIAEQNGELQKALQFWRKAVEIEPTSAEVHEKIAFLLSALESKKAAQDYLRKITRQFPYNINLQRLRLNNLQDETTEAIAVLRDLVRINPHDTWIRRELARWYVLVKKFEQALENANEAVRLDPSDAANYHLQGVVLSEMKKLDEAAESFKKAVSLSVDADYAFSAWMSICRNNEEKLSALRFMREELRRQFNYGFGVMIYREHAKRLLEPKELLAELKEFYAANKEQWFSLSVVVQQLVDMHEFGEARQLADKNTERFPLIHNVWHDLSTIYKLKGEHRNEVEALRKAVVLNANWSYGFQQLCEALQRTGELEEAKSVLRDALIRMPFDHFLHGYLAEIQWKLGEKDEALQTARKAVNIEPQYDWAWQVIKNWAEELKKPELALETAKELTVRKPKDARSWITYAKILESGQFSQKQLDAVEEALKLEPHNTTALGIKANCLADARRFDEAVAVCETVLPEGVRGENLQYVAAGVEAGRGEYEKSIKRLEELGKKSPDYYPAFERLAEIYRNNEERKADYLRVTQEMTRLAPQESTVFGFLGEADLKNGKREEAKKTLRQALTISPEYAYAGGKLFDLYYEDNEMDKCRSIVKLLRQFVNNENSLVRELVFYAKAEDWETVRNIWKEFCFNEKVTNHHFDFVFDKFRELNLKKQDFVLDSLGEYSLQPNVNPFVGAAFIDKCLKKKSPKACLEYLKTLPVNSEVWAKAVVRFMEYWLETDKAELGKFINENYRDLNQNDNVWASVGYMLFASNYIIESEKWFTSWKKREKLEPWMLWNYSLVLKNLSKYGESNEIHRTALELPQQDDTVSLHLMMLALEEVFTGNYEAAIQLFGQINPICIQGWDAFFYYLLETNLEIYRLVQQGETEEAKNTTRRLVKDVCESGPFWKDKVRNECFNRSLKAALALNRSGLLSLSLRAKVFFKKFG